VSIFVGIIQLLAIALTMTGGWMLVKQRRHRQSVEFIAPTWRRLAQKRGWKFIDGPLGTDPRLQGTLKGYVFTARALLEDGKVVLSAPLQHPSSVGDHLKVAVSSFAAADLMDALTILVAEAQELDDASAECWGALAAQHGLSLASRRGQRTLRGEIDGHSVRIGTQQDPSETVIRVRIGAPWPDGVLIQSRSAGAPSTASTGNPILDGLVTVTGGVDARTRGVLCDPQVAEDLIAVLHPFPRSSVVGGHVQMHCPGQLEEDLPDRLADALALASRLQKIAVS